MRIHDRIEAAFEAWGRFVVRNRFAMAVACLALAGGLIAFLPRLEADNSTESFLKPGDPARLEYDRFRAQFGQDEQILVAIQPPEVFALGFLEKLRALHQEIEREVPYVTEITSLWNVRSTRGEGDELVVEDFLESWPTSDAELALLRERALATPAYRNAVIDPEAKVTTILIEPFIYSTLGDAGDTLDGFDDAPATGADPEFLTEREKIEQLAALRTVVDRYRAPDFRIYLAGGNIIDQALNETLGRDVLVFMSGGVVLMTLLLFGLFRRASGVLVPIFLVLLAVASNLGAMAALGIPTSVSGQILPVLVLVVGISGSIHALAITFQRMGDGADKETAIAEALGHSGLAIFMATVTTAAGIVSFSFAPMAQIANLGLSAPIGVMLTFVFNVTLLPALLAIAPLRATRQRGDAMRTRLSEALARVGDAAARAPYRVLAGCLVLVAIAAVGVVRLEFSSNGMRWFPEDDPNKRAHDFLDAHLGGAGGVEVWVRTNRENGFQEPAVMQALDEASAFAATLDVEDGELTVANVFSVLDIVKETHQALNENRAAFYAVPDERALLAQELLLFENSGAEHLEDLVDTGFSQARISLRTPFADGRLYDILLTRLDEGMQQRFAGRAEVQITGIGSLMGRTFDVLNRTMAQSYALALLIITPLMVLLIGNLRLGLLSMLPNLLPIWLTLGFMGVNDIPLDNSTLLVGCVLIGLAVDDTIHFMHKYARYLDATGDSRSAVRETLRTTGAALFFTTLVLTAGFSVMLAGYMINSKEFGLLAGFAAMTAFLADLVLAPALMQLAVGSVRPKQSVARPEAA